MAQRAAQWRIRPAQDVRDGIDPLDAMVPPTVEEMAFDKVAVTVNGWVQPVDPISNPDGMSAAEQQRLLDGYRNMLRGRAAMERRWTGITDGRHYFSTRLLSDDSTIGGSSFKTTSRWDGLLVRLTIHLNPTRTLVHAFEMAREADDPLAALEAMPEDQFFGLSPCVTTVNWARDGNDNVLQSVATFASALGPDFNATFIRILERKLRRWALDAVAPLSQGFFHDTDATRLTADGPLQRVALNWPKLTVNEAEVYFERRHGTASRLMERSLSLLVAAHSDCAERRYPDASAAREQGCATVLIRQTKGRQLAIYAKLCNRIRFETRFKSRVKDQLRQMPLSPTAPLSNILIALRGVALRSLHWENLCRMLLESNAPEVMDLAELVTRVVVISHSAEAAPEPVLAALIMQGAIVETNFLGPFPGPLIKKLRDAGLIESEGAAGRRRPGAERRHHLREPYATAARAARQGFLIDNRLVPPPRRRPPVTTAA